MKKRSARAAAGLMIGAAFGLGTVVAGGATASSAAGACSGISGATLAAS